MKQIIEMLKAMQEKADADRKADQVEAEANQAKAEADREDLKGMLNVTQERLDANTKSMQENIKSGQAEMRSAIGAIEEKMDAWRANMKDDQEETTTCQYAMGTSLKNMESNSGEEEAVVEQQEICNEEVAVHSLRAYRRETAGSQEATEANTEKTEPD
jgi:hypothetical protein